MATLTDEEPRAEPSEAEYRSMFAMLPLLEAAVEVAEERNAALKKRVATYEAALSGDPDASRGVAVELVVDRELPAPEGPRDLHAVLVWQARRSDMKQTLMSGLAVRLSPAQARVALSRVRSIPVAAHVLATPREHRASPRRTRGPSSADDDGHLPQRCVCGCGEAVPAGKRRYVDDTHSNRARQRAHKTRARAERRSPELRYRELVWQACRAGALDGIDAIELLVWPSERVTAMLGVAA